MTEVQEAEVVEHVAITPEGAELATRPAPQPTAGALSLFGTSSPRETVAAATETASALTEVLEQQRLFTQMGKRRHVNVEGWTLLGSLVGVYPVVVEVSKVLDENGEWAEPHDGQPGKGGWEAHVQARRADGVVVGAAFSECRWSESNWATDDSFALKSMAQTRAVSRALRGPLDFIVKLAGFQSTPAEEVEGREQRSKWGNGGGKAPAGEYDCPLCAQHTVIDQRGTRENTKQPAFRCTNNDCEGRPKQDGGFWAWATWDMSFYDPKLPDGPPDNADEIYEWLEGAINDPDRDHVQTAKVFCFEMAGQNRTKGELLFVTAGDNVANRLGEQIPEAGWDQDLAREVTQEAYELLLLAGEEADEKQAAFDDMNGYG